MRYVSAQWNQILQHYEPISNVFVVISQPGRIAFATFCMKIVVVPVVFTLAVGHADAQGRQILQHFCNISMFLH
jgi:hypothetical protein